MAFPRNDNKMAKILAHQLVAKDLPEFTGNPSEWPRFLTRFKETNKLFEFSNEENLSRLNKALKGKAKQVAQDLMIHSNNVPMIISTLERNFGRPDFIIESSIEQVREAPSVYPGKFTSAVEFGNAINNLVAHTVALDQPRHLQKP
jgi:hypothetical protein